MPQQLLQQGCLTARNLADLPGTPNLPTPAASRSNPSLEGRTEYCNQDFRISLGNLADLRWHSQPANP